jgi:hypothetical protein
LSDKKKPVAVELGSGSDFERALALFLVQRGMARQLEEKETDGAL